MASVSIWQLAILSPLMGGLPLIASLPVMAPFMAMVVAATTP